jgi:hypothetical protein
MAKQTIWAGMAVLVLAAGSATTAMADDTGISQALHDLRREGGKLCATEHTHYASSSGMPTKKAAEIEAKRNWYSFTSWEYGTDWGNPALAGSPDLKCSQSSGGGWGCEFVARPCRSGGGGTVSKRKAG